MELYWFADIYLLYIQEVILDCFVEFDWFFWNVCITNGIYLFSNYSDSIVSFLSLKQFHNQAFANS